MNTQHTIYIPSKARANSCTTPHLLMKDGITNWLIVIEPQDFRDYAKEFHPGHIVVLDKNDQGLWYSRQFCKDRSISYGDEYHWQLDDDIRSFISRSPGMASSRPLPCEALREIEEVVEKYSNIGQAGMNQNSWPPGDNPIKVNRLPVQAFLVNNSVKAKFRTPILNDFDFTLQVLKEGWCTLLFDHIRTNTPPIGTNAGGLNAVYKKQEVMHAVMKSMCNEFGTMTIDKDEKGWHLRKNRIWSTFKQQLIEES